MNFPLDGLVFYAPLWHPELSGSPFLSKDLNVHTCTVYGATWTSLGRSFNGTSDYVDAGNAVSFDLTEAITVEAWVYLTAYNAAGSIVISKGYYSLVTGWTLLITSVGQVQFCINGWQTKVATFPTNLSLNTWYHLVGTYDREKIKVYVNTVKGTDYSLTEAIATNTQKVMIGTRYTGSGYWHFGRVGEARIYNRALSLAEIQHNYNATRWKYA